MHVRIQIFTIVWQHTQYWHVTMQFPSTLSPISWFGVFWFVFDCQFSAAGFVFCGRYCGNLKQLILVHTQGSEVIL